MTVWVGNSTCKVNSLDAVTLYCSPPPVPHNNLLPTVTVCATLVLQNVKLFLALPVSEAESIFSWSQSADHISH